MDITPFRIPLRYWVDSAVDYMDDHWSAFFDTIATGLRFLYEGLDTVLLAPPPWLVILLIAALAWRLKGWGLALFTAVGLWLLDALDLWGQTMDTLSLVLAAALIAILIGLPVGIAAARSNLLSGLLRPLLDFMQTLPAFVYLIPAIIFFGLGAVPGIMATIIFAMPPAIRLTELGIRQVPREVVEAAISFGSTPNQMLYKVQLPMAMPTILAGINQTIMLSLSMVVIASMIGAGGLGDVVLRAITQLEIGLGFEGGIGVVILAIILDRLTEAFGRRGKRPV